MTKMKHDADFEAAQAQTYRVAGDELRAFVERYERLEAEKKDAAEVSEEEAVLDMYKQALGM